METFFHNGTVDATGSPVSTLLYTAFGETRYGFAPTYYRYTGQRLEPGLGLYFYNARWYDPALGRFTQPDSLIPNPGNPQDWDRYAYVRNNPVNYNDPTGNKACDGEGVSEACVGISKSDIMKSIYNSFRWKINGKWTKKELYTLLDSGNAIEKKVSSLTNGNGRGWMLSRLGDTNFNHNSNSQKIVMGIVEFFGDVDISGIAPGLFQGKTIYLDDSGMNTITPIHELGHVLDNNSGGGLLSSTWDGGGLADDLIEFAGGKHTGIRWANNTDSLPESAQWLQKVDKGYGNNASAEYFAQSFAYLIVNPAKLPNPSINNWMEDTISSYNH